MESTRRHNLFPMCNFIPLDRMNPPRTSTASIVNAPKVFATIMSLPSAAIKRKSPKDIW